MLNKITWLIGVIYVVTSSERSGMRVTWCRISLWWHNVKNLFDRWRAWESLLWCSGIYRYKALCVAGFAGESGRSLFKTISAHPMLKAWGRETRLSSTCWRPRPNMCSSCPSWWTAFCGRSGWLQVPKNLRSATMTLAAFSSIGVHVFHNPAQVIYTDILVSYSVYL